MASESSRTQTGSLNQEKPASAQDIESSVRDSPPIEIAWEGEDGPANPQN